MKKLNRPLKVSEATVRGVAIEVFILSLIFIFTGSIITLYFLIFDFSIRVILIPRYSPLALISGKIIVPLAGFRRRQIVLKPKRFAAGIGMTMSMAALILNIYHLDTISVIFVSVLALFSLLEALFKFCAGCKIFGFIIKLGLISEDECPDCVYGNGTGI